MLHDSQQKLAPHASPEQIAQANQAALDAALAARLDQDDGLTPKQKFARETGDPDLMEQANAEALAQGIAASLDSHNGVPKSPRTSIPQEEFEAQLGLIAKLKVWMKKHGFDIKANNGNRNNCLIISMLQHATEDYDSNHQDRARHFKQKIVEWSQGKENSSSSLHSDDKLCRQLVDEINRTYFKENKDQYLRFKFVTADMDGEPAVREVGDGPRIAGIIDGGGHYEAYVKSGTEN